MLNHAGLPKWIHGLTAVPVLSQEVFGIINLISEYGLLDQMILYRATRKDGSRWTLDDCELMISEWFKIYPGVKRYHNSVIDEARQTGLSRESIGGNKHQVINPCWSLWADHPREAN